VTADAMARIADRVACSGLNSGGCAKKTSISTVS
jgi:hypothetical protein